MERNEHRYDREFRNKLHDRDHDYGRGHDHDYDKQHRGHERNNNEQFENYRDRYRSQGNYYGMRDEDHAYRNVKSDHTRPSDYRSSYGGPMQGSRNEDYRTGSQEHYHYGDPNPYMSNSRNTGAESSRDTNWRSESDSNRGRNTYTGTGYRSDNRYERQDNSYRTGGEGRRYSDFGRDEERMHRTSNSYNPGSIDSYNDRGHFKHQKEENDFGRNKDDSNPYYDGSYDDSDFRYKGVIRDVDHKRDNNYATGLYASNRAYVSEHKNRDSERNTQAGHKARTSGPDYSADSRISGYGYDNFGI